MAAEFEKAAIIGLGLIGGSLAAACKKYGGAGEIFGYDLDRKTVELARNKDLAERCYCTAGGKYPGIEEVDLVILAVPVKKIPGVLENISGYISSDTIITDTGSTKNYIMNRSIEIISGTDGVHFIGGHPLAGSEKSGLEHRDADLFKGAKYVLVMPDSEHDVISQVKKLKGFLTNFGSKVIGMKPKEHDRIIASISHLPQIAATILSACTGGRDDELSYLKMASSGFSDTTRLALSSPDIWCDILLTNKKYVLEILRAYQGEIDKFVDALENEDRAALRNMFQEGARVREKFEEVREE